MSASSVAVIGLGASGAAASRLALDLGAKVYASDNSRGQARARRAAALRARGAKVQLGGHDIERIGRARVIVASPGIPLEAPVLRALRARGRSWISEPEYAFRRLASQLIAVTGTNGKTTTAWLCGRLLRASGIDASVGGNIGADFGPPASELARLRPRPQWVVLELSSFQLAGIDRLRPDIGIFTNLGVDHLDRYPSREAYHADKRRLFEAGDENTEWILNADDPALLAMAADAPGAFSFFSAAGGRPRPGDAFPEAASLGWIEGGELVLERGGEAERLASAQDVPLAGAHNWRNLLAAALAARACGASMPALSLEARVKGALPHRLEPLRTSDGVRWINDSKATNVDAARSAISSVQGPLVVLIGGVDKGESFAPLLDAMHGKTRGVVAYGAAGPRIAGELAGAPQLQLAGRVFSEVVDKGVGLARPGDALLLSPACSSFDMFANYQARGEAFRRLAQEAAPC